MINKRQIIKINLIIFLFIISTSLFSQEKRIEEVYQECAYNTLLDKGKSLKRYAKGFEKYLISIKILKDSTSKSYYNLFKSFPSVKTYNTNTFVYSFSDSINLNRSERMKIFPSSIKCAKEVEKHNDYKKYKMKIKGITRIGNKNLKEVMKRYALNLKEDDFKLDFYKLQTFNFLYLIELIYDE